MNETINNKIFRAERTTQNHDDLKVMMVGSMIGILMLLVFPIIGQVYDKFWAERPFVKATIEVVQTDYYKRPMLMYDADATQPVTSTWIAIIRDQIGNRLETRRGFGNYSTVKDNPRLWTWAAFFDTETGTVLPKVPKQPFKVCLRYVSIANDSGIADETPETCSEVFFPKQKSSKNLKEYYQ